MVIQAPEPLALAQYRGYLLLLARTQWGEALRRWGEPSDLVHQTLLEAHERIGEFKGTTSGEFAGWLRAILAHNLADVIRGRICQKRDYRLERSLEAELDASSNRLGACLAADGVSPGSQVATAEQLSRLACALDDLPADYRDALTMHHLQNLPLKEVAARMGRTTAAVAGLLRRGMKQLRAQLAERE